MEDTKPLAMYIISDKMRERIETDFTYQRPNENQVERMATLRDKCKELAVLIVELTPPSREQSVALTNVEQVSMYANAAIARNERA